MPSKVSNSDLENMLPKVLEEEGYSLNSKRAHGETGVDIIAKEGTETCHIEAIGYKSSPPVRAKDFYESFFPIVSRLNDGAEK